MGGGEPGPKQPETPAISTETLAISTTSNELPPPLPEKRGKFKALASKAGAGVRQTASAPVAAEPETSPVKTAAATGSTGAASETGGFPQLGRLFSGLGGSDSVTSTQSPVLVYADLAHEIKRCWLAPDAFTVSIEPRSGGSTINSENTRLPSDVGGALQQDLARWSKGQVGCAS
jgi:hypothetical protein